MASTRRCSDAKGAIKVTTEKAILAGGCFWGVQDLIRRRPGVISTRVGYTGGDVPNATYRNHGNHAEAIEIIFDPEQISYRDLLEFFFQIHDPTTKNRQGNDVGLSYRSAIFYTSDEQRRGRRGHDRRRRRLRPVARQGRHRGRAGRPVLGGRARAPGLPASSTRTATPATSSGPAGGCHTGHSQSTANTQPAPGNTTIINTRPGGAGPKKAGGGPPPGLRKNVRTEGG